MQIASQLLYLFAPPAWRWVGSWKWAININEVDFGHKNYFRIQITQPSHKHSLFMNLRCCLVSILHFYTALSWLLGKEERNLKRRKKRFREHRNAKAWMKLLLLLTLQDVDVFIPFKNHFRYFINHSLEVIFSDDVVPKKTKKKKKLNSDEACGNKRSNIFLPL